MNSSINVLDKTISSRLSPVQFSRIVVGLDDDHATPILNVTEALAKHFGAQVFVVHGLPALLGSSTRLPVDYFERLLESAAERLEKLIGTKIGAASSQWVITPRLEDPAVAILIEAEEHNADLIILGSHGRQGFRQAIAGSVAQSVLSRAACPVLVVGANAEPAEVPWKRILFASDLDETGLTAAEYATTMAAQNGGELFLLHVESDKPDAAGRMREWIEDDLRTRLDHLLDPAVLASCKHELLIAYGDPAEEILSTADKKLADLIVLGTGVHGILGDHNPWRTAAHVLHSARCPILNVGVNGRKTLAK